MNVLLLTHRLPYAPNRGDRIRAWHLLHELGRHHEVALLSLVHDAEEAAAVPSMRERCTACEAVRVPALANYARGLLTLPGDRPLTHTLLSAPGVAAAVRRLTEAHPPAVVLAYGSGMAQYVFAPPLHDRPFVLDMVDVDSEKWRTQAAQSSWPARWIYAREQRTLAAFERRAAETAATTLVANERERQALAALAPGAGIRVVGNGIDVAAFAPEAPPAASSTVVFTGVMDYTPNVEAVVWFVHHVWPAVVAARPDARFEIVGASPTATVRALAGPTVVVTGGVKHTQPHLWQAAAAVAPLARARGVQNKVLEAVAAGLPTTVTPVVADGLPAAVMPAVTVAATPEAFARAVLDDLALAPEARRARAATASLDALSWPAQLAEVPGILAAAARTSRQS